MNEIKNDKVSENDEKIIKILDFFIKLFAVEVFRFTIIAWGLFSNDVLFYVERGS